MGDNLRKGAATNAVQVAELLGSAACCAPRAPSLERRWEEEAAAWGAWVRRDVYHHYAPAFFELVPPPGRATLDLGCGEGRVTRDLTARGHAAIGVDLSPTLVRMAAAADPGGDYRVAHASELHFDDDAFDLVVAYNVLMDVRRARGGGRRGRARARAAADGCCACVSAPAQRRTGVRGPGALVPGVAPVRDHRGARRSAHDRSAAWTHSFEDYSACARVRAGCVIEAVREPPGAPEVDAPLAPRADVACSAIARASSRTRGAPR